MSLISFGKEKMMEKRLHAWSINCDPCSCRWQHSVQSLHHWKLSKKPTSFSVVTLRDSCTRQLISLAGIFHLLIGSRLLQTLTTLFDSSLLTLIHTNGFQTPSELPQKGIYHVIFVRYTFQAGIRIVKICTKNIIPIMIEQLQIVYWNSWTTKENESGKKL
jgi:hypothetical protein